MSQDKRKDWGHIGRIMETELGERLLGDRRCTACQERDEECWVCSEKGCPAGVSTGGALVLVVVWLLVLAGAACQRDGLTGAGHHHFLDPGLSRRTSRQVVRHLELAAVQSRCEEVCGRVDVW